MNALTRQSRTLANTILIGAWWQSKFQRNQLMSGTQAAARNARKQGVPVEACLMMLARR